ncbi:hypothetical protein EZS27_020873 [termite gut metagenome]|uniref:Uncharacterized protein n=1 Tax=termite gut metagenome TaxID=433724 RepID=A0A5J4RBA3_9ZZZZ
MLLSILLIVISKNFVISYTEINSPARRGGTPKLELKVEGGGVLSFALPFFVPFLCITTENIIYICKHFITG